MSEPYNGDNCLVNYCEEQSFGQLPTSPVFNILPSFEAQPTADPRYIRVKTLGSDELNSIKRGMNKGTLRVSWFLPSTPNPTGFLKKLMDAEKSVAMEVAYFQGEWSDPDNLIALLFNGCKAERITLEVAASPNESEEALWRATADLIAQKVAVGTAKAGTSYSAETGSIAWGENAYTYVKKDTTWVATATKVKVDINYGLKPIPTIRDTNPFLMKILHRSKVEPVATLEFDFEDDDRWEDITGDVSADWSIGLGANGHYLLLDDAKLVEVGSPTKVDEIVYVTCKVFPKKLSLVTPS